VSCDGSSRLLDDPRPGRYQQAELQGLARECQLHVLRDGVALWRQDDGPAWGWGPFCGESAILLLEGELQVPPIESLVGA